MTQDQDSTVRHEFERKAVRIEPQYQNPLNKGKYRNDPCPCGSGKKIKRCHGIKNLVTMPELETIHKMIHDYRERFSKALEEFDEEELQKLSTGEFDAPGEVEHIA